MLRNITSRAIQAVRPQHTAVFSARPFSSEDVSSDERRLQNVDTSKCINKVTLLGRVANNYYVNNLSSGAGEVLNFTLVTNEIHRNRRNELVKRTEFHRVQVFSPALVTKGKRILDKGSRLMVEGRLNYNVRRDEQGAVTNFTNIIAENIFFFTGHQTARDGQEVQDFDAIPEDVDDSQTVNQNN